jgi:nucleoid-associated protein EbfC
MLKGLGGLTGLGDMAKMMKSAQDLQAKMGALQEELARTFVFGEAGGGLAKVTATAKGEITAVTINPSIVNSEDVAMLEDLILAAIKDVQRNAAATSAAEMGKLTESMGLPAGMKLPV